jgi:hypothetical protein
MVIIPGMFMAGARQGRLATSVNLQNTTFLFGGNATFSDCRYNEDVDNLSYVKLNAPD